MMGSSAPTDDGRGSVGREAANDICADVDRVDGPVPRHRERVGVAEPRPDGIETDAAAWCDPAAVPSLVMRPAMRLRLQHAITAPQRTHID